MSPAPPPGQPIDACREGDDDANHGRPAVSRTVLLVGTRKGLWVGTSDAAREEWQFTGPHFDMEEVYSCLVDTRHDPPRLYGGASSSWLGPQVRWSDDLGATWQETPGGSIRFPDDVDASVERIWQLAPGFEAGSDKYEVTVRLAVIMFPYLMCMSLTAMLSGMLNSLHHYFAAAVAPIFFNLTMIAALAYGIWVNADAVTVAYYLSWAVLAAGILQMVVLYVGVRHAGMSIGFRRPRMTPNVKRLLVLALPCGRPPRRAPARCRGTLRRG